MVETLDFAVLERNDIDLGAGLFQRLERLGQLDLFEAVGGHDGDLLALQLSWHALLLMFAAVSPRLS